MRIEKFVVIVVACGAVVSGAPEVPGKLFHEHVKDFIGVIIAESGLELEHLMRQYSESEDFGFACTYLTTTNFKILFDDLQTLSEYKAVVDYLEKANIDISYYTNRISVSIEGNEKTRHRFRTLKENEMAASSFVRDIINILPKKKLLALFEQKKHEDPIFRDAMDKLRTEEWDKLYSALWNNQEFKKAIQTLSENGLDVRLFIIQIKAAFERN